MDEPTAAAMVGGLVGGDTRQDNPHKNKLLHRYYYKMEAESTEKQSATDTNRQSQSGSMDGSQLGSLVDGRLTEGLGLGFRV